MTADAIRNREEEIMRLVRVLFMVKEDLDSYAYRPSEPDLEELIRGALSPYHVDEDYKWDERP